MVLKKPIEDINLYIVNILNLQYPAPDQPKEQQSIRKTAGSHQYFVHVAILPQRPCHIGTDIKSRRFAHNWMLSFRSVLTEQILSWKLQQDRIHRREMVVMRAR